MKCCAIIPTYNERENIEGLLGSIMNEFMKNEDFNMSILVVDDNSPDGTADLVEDFSKEYQKNIFLLKRSKKMGLGSAYIDGFKHVINDIDPDIIFEIDADLSHDPKEIPRFIEEIKKGYDFVIGSRYVYGGETPDWGIKRKMISHGGNFVARVIAGLPVYDCTSGYRAIRTSVLKKIDLDSLDVHGYAFQISLLHHTIKAKGCVKEIPIVFYDRKQGESKLKNKDIREFFLNAIKLRFQRS